MPHKSFYEAKNSKLIIYQFLSWVFAGQIALFSKRLKIVIWNETGKLGSGNLRVLRE